MNDSDGGDAMVNEESRETPAQNQESGEESEGTSDNDDNSSYVKGWERSYEEISRLREQQPRNSLKRRQLELLGAGVKQIRKDCDRHADLAREQFLQETKARWISLGMMKEEDADLLHSVDALYHPNIERTREEYIAKKKAEKERQVAEKARANRVLKYDVTNICIFEIMGFVSLLGKSMLKMPTCQNSASYCNLEARY